MELGIEVELLGQVESSPRGCRLHAEGRRGRGLHKSEKGATPPRRGEGMRVTPIGVGQPPVGAKQQRPLEGVEEAGRTYKCKVQ